MRSVKSGDTSEELAVRKICRDLGYTGYRLHRKDIPGKPDIAFIGRKAVIFVNGCFWHGHDCQFGAKKPKTNPDYWREKIKRNIQRDEKNQKLLKAEGWRSLVIWGCEIKQTKKLQSKIAKFMSSK